ncbi:MAG: cupin domain-containing protein [Bacteroidetes bacterium]|nr:cupin domain-containing protein [Bacteroidota bacterium]
MRRHLLYILLLCIIHTANAQFIDLDTIVVIDDYENVGSQKLYSDSLVSTFEIWVKKEVPLHKHEFHTEQVIVLEGEGNMRLGDEWKIIKPGDLIIIPVGTLHQVIVTSSIPLKVLSVQAPEFDGSDRVIMKE